MKKKQAAPRSLLHSLTRSIFLVHLCVLIVSLALSFVLLLSTSKKQYMRQSQASMDLLVSQFDSLTENLLAIRTACLLDSTFTEYLSTSRSYTSADVRRQQAVIEKLSSYRSAFYYIESFTLFQDNGITLNVTSDNRIHGMSSDASRSILETYLAQKTKNTYLFWGGIHPYLDLLPSYYSSTADPDSVVSLVFSLGNQTSRSASSALSANISVDYFHTIFSQNVPPGCFVSLYDAKGNLLLTSSEEHQTRKADSVLRGHLQNTDWYLEITIPFSVFFSNVRVLLTTSCVIYLLASLIISVLTTLVGKRLLNPFQDIIVQMDEIHRGNLEQRLSPQKYVELTELTVHFNSLMDRIQQLIHTTQSYAEEKRAMEVQALQAQINPHFLYNSLTTIRWMASMARAENVCQALLSLSNVLRPVFSDSSVFWSLNAEHTFLENYIAIMGYRIGYKTKLLFEMPEEYQEMEVPRFFLQPLVENSLMHGLSSVYDENRRQIHVTAEKAGEYLDVFVTDNGKGIPADQADRINADLRMGLPVHRTEDNKNSIGLYNVNRRLQLQYGEGCGLQILPADSGTVIRVRLRLQNEDAG